MSERLAATRLHHTTDVELVERVQRGDVAALGVLFDRYGQLLYRVAYRLLGSRDDAEDTVQDVFAGLTGALANYSEFGALEAWLRRVTVRSALMKRRAELRRRAITLDESDVESTSEDPTLALSIEAALESLPMTLRQAAVLRLAEGYSHEEIAHALGISVSASKVRVHRAIAQLRVTMGDG